MMSQTQNPMKHSAKVTIDAKNMPRKHLLQKKLKENIVMVPAKKSCKMKPLTNQVMNFYVTLSVKVSLISEVKTFGSG